MQTEKEQIQNQIQELQEKLKKLEEVENEKMEFEDEGRFHSFHYNGKSYHRLEYTVIPIVWWFVSLSTLEYPIPVYEKVMNSELNKKLEELYQKQIVPEEPEGFKTLYDVLRELDKPMFTDDVCSAVKEWMSQCTCDYVMGGDYLKGYEECLTILKENLK